MRQRSSQENYNMEPAIRQESGRNPDGTFKQGFSGNPSGRPKNTLKDYVREKFMSMTVEEKEAFLKRISPEIQWKMGEGNAANNMDITSGGKPLILPSEIIAKNESDNIAQRTEGDSE
jgi:hypothetical protein